MRWTTVAAMVAITTSLGHGSVPQEPRGIRLEDRTWVEAEKLLQHETVVVIPLGAALKEHGPHLKLRNDLTLAEYFTGRVLAAAPVVVTAPLTYHFYPAFTEYPGSTSLSLETARDLTIQVARSLARFGPKRFYVLNTGISTLRALEPAAALLAREGILLRYTDLGATVDRLSGPWRQQPAGSHADEIETSMLLYIDPSSVDMKAAVRDISPWNGPPFTRQRGPAGTFSPSGVWGDATVASREKGQVIVEGLITVMLQDIEALRTATPPAPQPQESPGPATPRPEAFLRADTASGCLAGIERDLKRVEAAFNSYWNNRDHERLGALWSMDGDLVHQDGTIEKGRRVITENRGLQFRAREYRAARHSLVFGTIRCLNADIAIVDGRWDLRDVTDAAGKGLPRTDGAATLVLQRANDAWLIEAYRYHVRPGGPPAPTLLKKPGWPDKTGG